MLLSSRCTPGAFTLTSKAAAQATRRRAWAALAARTQAPGSWQQGSAPAVQMERDGVLLHPRNKYIKDPGLDAVIQMQRQRVQRGLDIDKQKRSVSGISGGVLHKQLQLDIIEKEIKILEEVSVCDARATRAAHRMRPRARVRVLLHLLLLLLLLLICSASAARKLWTRARARIPLSSTEKNGRPHAQARCEAHLPFHLQPVDC